MKRKLILALSRQVTIRTSIVMFLLPQLYRQFCVGVNAGQRKQKMKPQLQLKLILSDQRRNTLR